MQFNYDEKLYNPFPIVNDEKLLYLDSSGKSMQPLPVEKVGIDALIRKSSPWNGIDNTNPDEIRLLYSKIINASQYDIAICHSTSYAISIIAANVVNLKILKNNQKVVILEDEMASSVYPWQNAVKLSNSSLVIVKDPAKSMTTDSTWTDAIISEIDANTAIICIPNVHWCDGRYIDLIKIRKFLDNCSFKPPLLVIDGTQSIGALPFDVSVIKPAFVACSVHKWLCSPFGMSLVYLNPEYQEFFQPIDFHERNRIGSDNALIWDEIGVMSRDVGYPEEFKQGAQRIDAGGRPNPVIIPMVKCALELVLKHNPVRIQNYLNNIVQYLIIKISSCSLLSTVFSVVSVSCYKHFIGLRLSEEFRSKYPESSMSVISKLLKDKYNVVTAVRYQALRISPYIYTTLDDIDSFVSRLSSCLLSLTNCQSKLEFPLTSSVSIRSNKRVILITGVSGWLGQFLYHHLINTLSFNEFAIFGTYNNKVPQWLVEEYRVKLDLTNKDMVESVLVSIQPDVIIHLAAVSAPAACNKDPQYADQVNNPSIVIDAMNKLNNHDCVFIYTSTDLVYDGEKHQPDENGLLKADDFKSAWDGYYAGIVGSVLFCEGHA